MTEIVQCGWCPVMMPLDWPVIHAHFVVVHKLSWGNHSVRYIRGPDWDVAEISP